MVSFHSMLDKTGIGENKKIITSPATNAPDTAVRKTSALTPIVIPRIFFIDDKAAALTVGFFVGIRTSMEVHKSTEYKTIAVDKCDA